MPGVAIAGQRQARGIYKGGSMTIKAVFYNKAEPIQELEATEYILKYDGVPIKAGIHRDGKYWKATDVLTGRGITPELKTKSEVVSFLDDRLVKEIEKSVYQDYQSKAIAYNESKGIKLFSKGG